MPAVDCMKNNGTEDSVSLDVQPQSLCEETLIRGIGETVFHMISFPQFLCRPFLGLGKLNRFLIDSFMIFIF